MKLGKYELIVTGGVEDSVGYVLLAHGQRYCVELRNFTNRRCDAALSIDGILVGTFRIAPEQAVVIERPVHDDGHFTFYELGSHEARTASLARSNVLGLVQAVFKPEYETKEIVLCSSPSSGGTGLSGKSSQEFGTASPIEHAPESEFVTISLRLGGHPHSLIRPLAPQPLANAVPPPLD
jgi:hypothetical protein